MSDISIHEYAKNEVKKAKNEFLKCHEKNKKKGIMPVIDECGSTYIDSLLQLNEICGDKTEIVKKEVMKYRNAQNMYIDCVRYYNSSTNNLLGRIGNSANQCYGDFKLNVMIDKSNQ